MIFASAGTLIAFSLSYILPHDDEKEKLMNNQSWRIIYVVFPEALFCLQFIGIFYIIKYDTIKYLIKKNNILEARLAIKQIYKWAETD